MVRSIARWRTLAGVALVVACALPSPANQSPRTTVGSVTDSAADSAAVSATLDRFLRAFERLDWQTFRRAFADDATVFFPSAATPARHVGRAAYEARFQQEFSGCRGRA